MFYLHCLLKSLLVIVPFLLSIAFLTLAERKIMGSMQRRLGPNMVGIYGLLQPIADGVKLFLKEAVLPSSANSDLFIFASVLSLFLSFVAWAVIPFGKGLVISDLNLGLLYILAISALGVYGFLFSGWASNSKYALFGGLRSTAQMISYEVSLGLILLGVLLCSGSFNFTTIVYSQKAIWYLIPLFPIALLFYISIIAETSRAPFDLVEAESELVSGAHTEYSGIPFVNFFLAEYGNMILMSTVTTLLFLGGWGNGSSINLGLKVSFLLFGLIWIRGSFPRYRYSDLMSLCWKSLLPIAIGFLLFIGGILIAMDWYII